MLFDGFDFEKQSDMLKEQINTLNNIKTSQKITGSTLFDSKMAEQYANALKSIDSSHAALILSTQRLNSSQIAATLTAKEGNVQKAYEAMANAGLLTSRKKLTAAQFKDNMTKALSTQMSQADAEAKTREIMVSMGLSSAFGRESKCVVKLNSKKLASLVQSHKLTEAEATEIAMINGVTFSMNKQASAAMPKWLAQIRSSILALKEQAIVTAKWLILNPVAWTAAAAAGIYALNKMINSNIKSLKEQKELLENTNTNISNNDSKISGFQENIASNKQQIEQLAGSENPSDSAKIQMLQNENLGYQMQLELLKSINEQEKLTASQISKDIINNTALTTTFQQELDNLKNFDLKGFISDHPATSAIKDAFNALKENNMFDAVKKLIPAMFKASSLTSSIPTLIPHKENDKGIVEETSDQIKSISGLRDELADLEKQRGSMSTDKYLKAEQKISNNFIFQFS